MAEWSSSYVTSLPDSAFACPDSRKYPHHNKAGAVDLPHLRAALSRVGDPSNDQCGKAHLQRHARALGMGGQKAFEEVPMRWLDDDAFGILAIPYGGPIEKAGAPYGADLQGEWFDETTDIKPDWFSERPTLWHHGKDPSGKMGTTLVGKAVNLHQEDDGWWVDFWWKAGEKRVDLVRQLGRKGAHIYGSSSTLPSLAKVEPSGRIAVWPYVEQTLSTAPVNTFSYTRPMKAMLEDFEAADIEDTPWSSALKALLPELDDLASDLDAEGSVEPPSPLAMSERDLRKLERLVDQLLEQARRTPRT